MTVLTQSLRTYLHAPCRARGAAPSAREEARVLLGAAVFFLIGGAAVVLHALMAVTAFQ